MKIKEIEIENFKSIKHEKIIFPQSNILALVGPNNAGKSNIVKAINYILGDTWLNKSKLVINDFYQKKMDNAIKIKIIFDNDFSIMFDSSGEEYPIYSDSNGQKINQWNLPVSFESTGSAKSDFPCTYLEANRSVEKCLQFKSWELMGKIAKSFNEKVVDKKMILEQKFDEIINIFDEVKEFKQFKDDFVNYFEEMQSDSPYKLKVDFRAFTPLNYFRSINILANDSTINDSYDTDVIELGDGNRNLILFALFRSYAKNFKQEARGILAIEEPEIYMHPQAQKHLYSIFKEIVKDSNIQIIFTTHSANFVETEEFYQIGLVSKDADKGTKVRLVNKDLFVKFCKLTGVPDSKTTVGNISEFYATTSNKQLNEAFFSNYAILVEGDTEELTIPCYLKKNGIDCDSKGISIIGVKGKNQIPKYWRLFKIFGIRVLPVIDSDNGSNEKDSNKNICNCFNIALDLITQNVDICKIIDSAIKIGEKEIKQKILVIEKDFEFSIKSDIQKFCQENKLECKYDEIENEARQLIKPINDSQKGQIARFIAKKICDIYTGFKPVIIQKIENILKENKIA